MAQLIQVIGSLLILGGFAASQRGTLAQDSTAYLSLNLVGSAILAVLAGRGQQWGFLLLEGSWAIVSGLGLALAMRRRRDR